MEVQLRDTIPYLSPNPTLSTVPSSFSQSFDVETPQQAPRGKTVTIEHRVANSSNGDTKLLFGLSRRLVGFVATGLMLSATGGCAFFFTQWLQTAGLRQQVKELEVQVLTLKEQNEEYAQLNAQLKESNAQLNTQVGRLSSENDRFLELNGSLQESNTVLNETVSLLQSDIRMLETLNAEYLQLNGNLTSIVSFLNETTLEFHESVETLIVFLSDQIEINRQIVLESLHNVYIQRIATWDCDMRDYFRGEEFLLNEQQPIANGTLPQVLRYVDERVLTELCIDRRDFEAYMLNQATIEDRASISLDQLVSGVQRYTTMTMDYYFPDEGDDQGGLTLLEWAEASYSCERIPESRRFSFVMQ